VGNTILIAMAKNSREILIYCPKCSWEPQANSTWFCNCSHCWNTFETAGNCPECGKQHETTQCLSCQKYSRHHDWYHQFIAGGIEIVEEIEQPATAH
jgi:predicted amidophosphoribosyltransferase